MNKNKRWYFMIPIILFMVLGLVLWKGLGKNTQKIPSALLNKTVPQFSAPDLVTGQNKSSTQALTGQISLVNIWATWCVPCKQEHATLMTLKQRYPIAIYGINYKDNVDDAKQWLKEAGNPYTLTWQDSNGKLGIEWGVSGVPETFLVDKRGVIRYRYSGPLTMTIFQQQILPMIASLHSEQMN